MRNMGLLLGCVGVDGVLMMFRVVSLGYDPTFGVDRRTVQYAVYVAHFLGMDDADFVGIICILLRRDCIRVLSV